MFAVHGIIAAMKKLCFVLLMLLLQSGCATIDNDFDPLEPGNRAVDSFNTSLDNIALRPVSKAYTATIPPGFRIAIGNFFDNLLVPNTVVNDVLQGKLDRGIKDTYRFVINSTIGLFGLIDVASYTGVKKHKEDFGQTLAVWGVDQGAYLVYPVLGPNSVRNTAGTILGYALDGATYLSWVMSPEAAIATTVLKYIDQRAQLEDAIIMRDEIALDAYVFTREAWRQSREYNIYDGHPPAINTDDDFDDDFDDFEDDFDSE